MTNTRVLVTGATGKIGGAVAAQLLEKGVSTRALVHRDDARAARLRALGAEVVVADMLDILQVEAAVDGVDRLFFNPPYHPHGLDSAVAFAVAAHRAGVEAVVALGQWLASPEHPSLMTRHHWLIDKLWPSQLLTYAFVARAVMSDRLRRDDAFKIGCMRAWSGSSTSEHHRNALAHPG